MDLVDRYLQAVKEWLPARHKKDIIAELADDIRSEIEEKERELGRKIPDAEVESILKRRGRPIVAAGRYRAQRSLIGPTLFPIYAVSLRVLAIPLVMLSVARWVYLFVSSPSVRAEQPATLLLHAASTFWSTALLLFGVVTLAFAVLERVQDRTHFLERWNPGDLAPVRRTGRIERSSSITELAIQVAFMLWWVRPGALVRLESAGSSWSAGATWDHLHHGFYVPVLLVSLATIGLSCANLARPYWTRTRLGLRAATYWAEAFIAVVVLAQGWRTFGAEWSALKGAGRQLSEAAAATAVTDILIYLCVASVGIGASIAFGVDVVRALRLRARESAPLRPAPQSTEAFCI